MKKLILVLFILILPCQVKNWQGKYVFGQKKHEQLIKNWKLRQKYPPEETDWAYQISLEVRGLK